jgi:hypothetical protein
VLTIESERPSALRLGYGEEKTIIEADWVSAYDNSVVIRWGNSKQVWAQSNGREFPAPEFKRVINPRAAIRLNCNKPLALKELSQVVNTPRIWFSGEMVPTGVEAVYRADKHAGGEGFNVTTGPFVVREECYATAWIPSNTEFRVWFCGDSTMCGVRWKRSVCTDKYPCRSLWGYDFKNKVPVALHNATLKAAAAIGLECGAADILYFNNNYYFLELNSAATIDKLVIEQFYRDRLRRLIKRKYPEIKQ